MVAEESISTNQDFEVACSLFMLFKMLQYFDDNKVSGLASKCNKTFIYDIERCVFARARVGREMRKEKEDGRERLKGGWGGGEGFDES